MWDFERPPRAAELAERYSLHSTLPSRCADELLSGRADLGLIPIASLRSERSDGDQPQVSASRQQFVRTSRGKRRVKRIALRKLGCTRRAFEVPHQRSRVEEVDSGDAELGRWRYGGQSTSLLDVGRWRSMQRQVVSF